MKPRHKVSPAGIELIKAFEGYRRAAAQLADGRWTIGYGHSKSARRGVEVSEQEADLLLRYDLIEVAAAVNSLTFTPLTQNQFDALVSFAFNIGLRDFRRSIVLRRVNEGALLQAACALELWRRADFEGERIVVDALVRRRAAEKTLFLTPPEGWVPAPSPVLPPRLDLEDGEVVPGEPPVELAASLEGETATVSRGEVEAAAQTPPDNVVTLHPAGAPSQITEASQALSARLEAIFTGAEEVQETQSPVEPEPVVVQPEPAPEPELPPEAAALQPAPQPKPEPAVESPRIDHSPLFEDVKAEEPWPEAARAAEPEAAAASMDDPSPFKSFRPRPVAADFVRPQPIYREAPARQAAPAPKAKGGWAALPYLVLAFAGFFLFALASSWTFRPHAQAGGAGPVIGGVVGALVGIGCVAWAVYVLTSRFNGRED